MAIGSNNRYENLDGLKVIAAFGIVAMHVSSNMGHPLTSEIATNVIGSMTHFVKLFLILSGFGMCCGYYEKFKRGASLNAFYSRRFAKNLPFFALLNVAYGVVLLLTIVLTIIFALIAKRVIDICFRRLKKAER